MPKSRPLGHQMTRPFMCFWGTVSYPQFEKGEAMFIPTIPGAFAKLLNSSVFPASTKRTLREASAESRLANTQPADPPPTKRFSKVLVVPKGTQYFFIFRHSKLFY